MAKITDKNLKHFEIIDRRFIPNAEQWFVALLDKKNNVRHEVFLPGKKKANINPSEIDNAAFATLRKRELQKFAGHAQEKGLPTPSEKEETINLKALRAKQEKADKQMIAKQKKKDKPKAEKK